MGLFVGIGAECKRHGPAEADHGVDGILFLVRADALKVGIDQREQILCDGSGSLPGSRKLEFAPDHVVDREVFGCIHRRNPAFCVQVRSQQLANPVRELASEAGRVFAVGHGRGDGLKQVNAAAFPFGTPVKDFARTFEHGQRDCGSAQFILGTFFGGLCGSDHVLQRVLEVGYGDADRNIRFRSRHREGDKEFIFRRCSAGGLAVDCGCEEPGYG